MLDCEGNMDDTVQLREWLYIDSASNTQRGPATLSMLTKMLEKGIGITGSTLAWKTGMENWKAMAEVMATTMMIIMIMILMMIDITLLSSLSLEISNLRPANCFSQQTSDRRIREDNKVSKCTVVLRQF